MLRLSREDRKDRMGGIAVVVLDPLVVRGLYDTGGFLATEALFSSDAVLCRVLMSKSSRWPDKPSLVAVASAGGPPEGGSLSCADGGGFAEMGGRLCRTVTIVSVDLEANLTPLVLETALSSDVARFTWAGGLGAGKGAGASWNVDARDLTGSECANGGAGETALRSEAWCLLASGLDAVDGGK